MPTVNRRGTLVDRLSVCLANRARGQDIVEYGVLIATIAVVILLGVTAFCNQIEPWLLHLAGRITTVGT